MEQIKTRLLTAKTNIFNKMSKNSVTKNIFFGAALAVVALLTYTLGGFAISLGIFLGTLVAKALPYIAMGLVFIALVGFVATHIC